MGKEAKEASFQADVYKIIKNAGVSGLGDIFFKFFNYLTVWLVVRLLGPGEYGLYLLAWTIVTFASILSSAGFPAGLIKFVSQFQGTGDKPRLKGIIQFSLQLGLTLSLLLLPLLILGSGCLETLVFKKPHFASALRWLSLSLPFITCSSLLLSSIQGFQVIKYRIQVEKFWCPISFLGIVVFFLWLGTGLKGLIIAKVGSSCLECLLALYFLNRIFPWSKEEILPICEKRQILTFSFPLIGAVFLNFFVLYTDILMLGYFRSSEEVGIYGVIARIVPLILLPLTSFEVIFSPMVADLFHRNQLSRLEELHKLITKWISLFSLPVFWIILLFARPLLQIFGKDFAQAQIPLLILALGQISRPLVGISGYMVLMTGHQNLSLINNAILFGLNTILNIILIPRYGILGAAIATSCPYIIINILEMSQILHLVKIHPYSPLFAKPLVASFSSFLLVFVLVRYLIGPQPDLGMVALGSIIFIGSYVLFLKLFGFSKEDEFIINKIKLSYRSLYNWKNPF